MQNPDTSLACFEISTPALGYRLLDSVIKEVQKKARHENDIEILEASITTTGGLLLLLQGMHDCLAEAERLFSEKTKGPRTEDLIDREIIKTVSPRLIPSLYSLNQQNLEEALLIVETETNSGGLAIANHLLLKDDVKLIDLRVGRGLRAAAIAFFTGTQAACTNGEQDVRALLTKMARNGRVELIENPSPSFRRLFNLDGKT